MEIDKKYCMSSFLMFRAVMDENKCFYEGVYPQKASRALEKIKVHNSDELYDTLKQQVEYITSNKKAALALSGGTDSAILARFMPKGSTVYTFKCVVEGKNVTDETASAKKYAEFCGLQQKIVEITWEDFEKYAPVLMRHKGAPLHSIEIQIYKAALQAKEDGFETLIFAEGADALYGGLSKLLSKDWTFGEFVDRYSFVKPYYVLKDSELILAPYFKCEKDGYIDVHRFLNQMFECEYLGSYVNACDTAGIEFFSPFTDTELAVPLDLSIIRDGKNKYLIREIFERLYPGFTVPEKLPMPRAVNEWFADWEGPKRDEFIVNCCRNMTGDQKWLIWCLEKFIDMYEEEK